MTIREKEHVIERGELVEFASLGILRAAATKLPAVEHWPSGVLARKPAKIYDINGSPLFFDFEVRKRRETLGTVRLAASKVLGSAVIAYEIGPRFWSYRKAVEHLKPKVQKKYRSRRITRTRLVCYSYPKLGVMFEMVDTKGGRSRVIYDVASLKPVPEGSPDSGLEGAFAWSLYGALDQKARTARVRQFDKLERLRLEIPRHTRMKLREHRPLEEFTDSLTFPIRFKIVRELPFCSHYSPTEARSHHSFVLHGQERWDYCAVATCQMILCHYRYYHTQDQIAPSLGYTSGNGCPADQSAGYESLSHNHLEATFDTTANWSEARAELDKLHPLKSGVPGHARACAGYAYTSYLFSPNLTERMLFIYDPSPWNTNFKLGGSVYWEHWDSKLHTNFIYTEIKTS